VTTGGGGIGIETATSERCSISTAYPSATAPTMASTATI
jgi:hypothetical protein